MSEGVGAPVRVEESAELTIGDLWRVLSDNRIAILILSLLGGSLAAVLAFIEEPVYRAEVLLSAATGQDTQISALGRLAEQLAPGLSVTGDKSGFAGKEVWIATLRSRRLMEQFIQDRNLLPILYYRRWDASAGRWKDNQGSRGPPTTYQAYLLFTDRILRVREDARTGLVTVSVEWRDPKLAAEWANDIVARANEYIRSRTVSEARESVEFLESELKKADVVAVQQAISRLIEAKVSEIVLANVRKEYAFAIVDSAVESPTWDYVRPDRPFIIVMGICLGFIVGIIYASIRWALKRSARNAGAAA
jgi:uncharacterized protein involved in exopolysaccharide biosynthesis